MRSKMGVSAFPPSLLLSEPVSVPGMGSLILIDRVIHSADILDDSVDSKKEQVCELCLIQMESHGPKCSNSTCQKFLFHAYAL